jgi:hypothetical protein
MWENSRDLSRTILHHFEGKEKSRFTRCYNPIALESFSQVRLSCRSVYYTMKSMRGYIERHFVWWHSLKKRLKELKKILKTELRIIIGRRSLAILLIQWMTLQLNWNPQASLSLWRILRIYGNSFIRAFSLSSLRHSQNHPTHSTRASSLRHDVDDDLKTKLLNWKMTSFANPMTSWMNVSFNLIL